MSKKLVATESSICTIKVGTCSTLSGRSELSYHAGKDAQSEIYLRVVSNSGGGRHNADWVALSVIEKLLTEHPVDKPMTSRILQPLFFGRSSNTAPFLFATLLSEGLVCTGKESEYLLGNIEAFKQAMSAMGCMDLPTEPVRKRKGHQ